MPDQPPWLRILDIILGVIAIVFGALLFILPSFIIAYGIGFILGIGLIILGLWQIIKILIAQDIEMNARIISIIIGIMMIIFGGLFIVAPTFFPTILVLLLSGAILIVGIFLLVQGAMGKEMKQWIRILYFLFGIIAIGITIPAFVFPMTWGLDLVSIAVSIALVFFGALRLIVGITGDYT
ncbi:MAG: DUF308 domain-containing protein [Candidatus Hermodarchaeota archaeon]|nr:DUF308 domain-containing protein [Candidatus Hermodarchaeota archaeon]